MTRAAIYLRVSTEAQAERELPLDGQRRECLAYAERRGYAIATEYCDAGVTGRTDERAAFQRMLAEARTGAWQVVIVWEYSRFSRRLWHKERYIEELELAGVTVESVTEGGSSWERIIKGKVSQDESAMLGQRTMRGKVTGTERGRWSVGFPPYGYARGPDGRLVIVPEEAAFLRLAFDRLVAGSSMIRTAEELTALGYRTRSGAPWHYGTLRRNLTNPAVFGMVSLRCHKGTAPREVRAPGAHEAILDLAAMEALGYRVRRTHETRPAGGSVGRRATAPLSGLARCLCGSGMTHWRDRRYVGARYYVCQARYDHARCRALPYIRADVLEPLVLSYVWEHIYEEGALRRLAESLADGGSDDQQRLETERVAAARHRRQLERQEANVVDAIAQGGASVALLTRLSSLEEQVAAAAADERRLEEELVRLSAHTDLPADLEAVIAATRASVEVMAGSEANRFLRSLLLRVEVLGRTEFRAIPRPGLPPLT